MQNRADIWWNYGIAVVEKLSACGMNWNALEEAEQEIAALWKLEADVFSGGFEQFFCNWGYEAYCYAIKALEAIGAYKMCMLMIESYDVIARFEEEELEKLWDIPAKLTEDEWKKLEALFEKICSCEEDLAELAYNKYCLGVQ